MVLLRRLPSKTKTAPGATVLHATVLSCTFVLGACSADPPPITGRITEETFASTIAGDDYLLRLRLPPNYDGDTMTHYPLVVQLDPTFAGLEEFATSAGIVSRMAAEGRAPEAIVLGVDYPDPYTRVRDYAAPEPIDPAFGGGGADRFHAVLRDEILPHVEGRYRVDSSNRVLVGHSLGGFFALYAAFRHDPAAAPLFAGIVAADPSYSEDAFTYETWHAARSQSLPLALYLAIAEFDGALQQINHEAMLERLASRQYGGLRFAQDVFETDHGGIIQPAFERGLDVTLGGAP